MTLAQRRVQRRADDPRACARRLAALLPEDELTLLFEVLDHGGADELYEELASIEELRYPELHKPRKRA